MLTRVSLSLRYASPAWHRLADVAYRLRGVDPVRTLLSGDAERHGARALRYVRMAERYRFTALHIWPTFDVLRSPYGYGFALAPLTVRWVMRGRRPAYVARKEFAPC